MSLKSGFHYVMIPFTLLVAAILALAACSAGVQPPSERPTILPAPTPIAQTEVTTQSPQGNLTLSPIASKTLETPKATPTRAFESLEIESGDPRYVSAAFWAGDGKIVYYAFARSGGARPLEWAAYDVTTRSTTIISSPLKYDPLIWKGLSIPEPDPNGIYVELQGFISPSGQRVIYDIPIGHMSPIATPNPQRPPITEIWTGDYINGRKTKVGEIPGGWRVYKINWFDDETKAVLAVSAATSDIYIADLQMGKVTHLEAMSNIKIVESAWLGGVSPDNKYLAIISDGELWLVSLKSGLANRIDAGVDHAQWSRDGTTLYYDHIVDKDIMEFRAYNMVSDQISTLIRQPRYETIGADFAVSPNGDKVLFWGGWLQLVELHR